MAPSQRSSFDVAGKVAGLMEVQFAQTSELTNQKFAAVATLLAYYKGQK